MDQIIEYVSESLERVLVNGEIDDYQYFLHLHKVFSKSLKVCIVLKVKQDPNLDILWNVRYMLDQNRNFPCVSVQLQCY